MAAAQEDPSRRLARLEQEIARARRHLAALRHEGERHFIDDRPVHPEVGTVLVEIVRQGDELVELRAMATGSSDVNRAFTEAELDDQHRALDALEERIKRLEALLEDDPHKHERHFIDG